MPSYFVFMEMHDPPAVALLQNLRAIFKGRESNSPIHITVRGPYKNPPQKEKLEGLWSMVEGEGLLLNGVGVFEFEDKHVVFIRSHSKAIRKIWWKRDFPIIKFGFNPHITLYEGSPANAKKVLQFLRAENVELYCRQLSLSVYESWKNDLFSSSTRTTVHQSPLVMNAVLVDPYRWKRGIEERAMALMKTVT